MKHILDKLNCKIDNILKENGIAGCSVAVTNRRGLIYSRGFGTVDVSSGAPTLDNSIYRAASVTKMVTGALTMRLVEEERLSLDSLVKEYIPELSLESDVARDTMTIRHLLSHTSGLPKEYTPEGPLDEGMLADSLFSALPTLHLESMPEDRKYLYSNWGIRLLSLVLERITGERFSSLAQKHILVPLGMRDSFFFLPEDRLARRSLPHYKTDSGLVSDTRIKENYTRLATGGLYSTATDLATLARFYLCDGVTDSGERIISAPAISEMRKPISQFPSGDTYGLTIQMHTTPCGIEVYGHYGNADPYTSALYVCPDYGLGAVVLLNTYHDTLRRVIAELLIDTFAEGSAGETN